MEEHAAHVSEELSDFVKAQQRGFAIARHGEGVEHGTDRLTTSFATDWSERDVPASITSGVTFIISERKVVQSSLKFCTLLHT